MQQNIAHILLTRGDVVLRYAEIFECVDINIILGGILVLAFLCISGYTSIDVKDLMVVYI